MATVLVTHRKIVTIPDDPNYPVGSGEWNDTHVITGLENVDNTSDVNKPVSTAQAAAIAASTATVTKASIGLGSVDNTSDATKNSATATLTNKSIDGGSNTLTNIPATALNGLGTGVAAALADAINTTGGILTYAVPLTLGQVSLGAGTTQDAISVHGQTVLYFPNIPSDLGVFANTFYGNGGANLTHATVNTTSPGVSTFATVTMTIAAPCVVTWTGIALAADTPVAFTNSGGALPTGITAGTTYFVARSPAPTTNTFSFAATVGGTAITTTGSQSGTQTGYTISLEGRYNLLIGQQSGLSITNGAYNTGGGFETMFNTISGSWNTGWGEAVLFSNVNGNGSAGTGWKALLSCIDSYNTANGYGAMLSYVGVSGRNGNNVATGAAALSGAVGATFYNVTGNGYGVGSVLSSGHDLVLSGTSTAGSATTMSNGVVIGSGSAPNATTSTGLTIVGDHTGGGIITGTGDTIIGGGQNSLPSGLTNEIRISDGTGALGFRSDSSRNTTLGAGVLNIPGGQIAFPATQNPSADPNTLDDYEEGTFTPVLSFGGASVGITYGTQAGQYTKIGNVVHYALIIILTSVGSSTGSNAIGGLPFTSGTMNGFSGSVQVNNLSASTTTQVQVIVATSSTTLNLSAYAAGTNTAMTNSNFTNTSVVRVTGIYFTS